MMVKSINGILHKKIYILKLIFFAYVFFFQISSASNAEDSNTGLSKEAFKNFQQPITKQQTTLVKNYELYYQNGDLKKAHNTFKELFLNHKEFIPLTIYLKHCHTLIEHEWSVDTNYEIYNSVENYLGKMSGDFNQKDPDRENPLTSVLDEVLTSILLKKNFSIGGDEAKSFFTEDLLWLLNNERNFYPDSPYYLEIRNIIDLDLINILHELGLILEADIILMQLLALNSKADGYVSKQSKKKLTHHLLWTFSYFGRKDIADELITILESNLEKEKILSYSNSLNSDNYVLLDYLHKNEKYSFAKKNFLNINPVSDSAYYFNLDLMIENALMTNDIHFLNYIESEANRIDYQVLNTRIKLTKIYLKIINGIDSHQELTYVSKLGNELIENLDRWANEYIYDELANEETIEWIRDSNKRYTGLINLILFEVNVATNNYEEITNNLEGIWQAVNIVPGAQFGVSTSSESQYKNFLKDRLFFNFLKIEEEYKKKHISDKELNNISTIILQILSKVEKPQGEIELNMSFLAKARNNTELTIYVTKFLESIRNRSSIAKKLLIDFYQPSKEINYNQYLPISIYDDSDADDFEYILDVEKDLAFNREQIKRVDRDFFKKAFRHSFKTNDAKFLLKENQSFYFYDQSDNFIFNCEISIKKNSCRSKKIKSSIVNNMVIQYRKNVINKKNDLGLKNSIQEILFPFSTSSAKNGAQFITLLPQHMGLPLNLLFDQNSFNDVVLVPSLASSTLRLSDKKREIEGEYFGVGGNIFSKTKTLSGLNKIFDIRSGGKLSSIKELAFLPGTSEEIESVFSKFNNENSKIVLGEKATEHNIRKEDFGKYKFLHFATHGLVSGEIKGLNRPALALTPGEIMTDLDDGILTASDIAEMDISSDVVLLSACQTASDYGRGNSSGISNLALSFLNAGSKKVVVSQWKVDDFATKEIFVNSLYKNSFKQTKFDLKKGINFVKNKYKQPYYWAPFIQVSIPSRYNSSTTEKKITIENKKIIPYAQENHADKIIFQEKNNKDLLINPTLNTSNFSISSFWFPDDNEINYYGIKVKSKNASDKFEVLKSDNFENPAYIINDKYDIIVRQSNSAWSNQTKIIHGQKNPIYLKKNDEYILYDEINMGIEHGWGLTDSLIIKDKLYLLYKGHYADNKGTSHNELDELYGDDPEFKDIIVIIYDLKKKSYQRIYKTFDFETIDSFYDPDHINFLIINNKVHVSTFNDYDDFIGKHEKYFAALAVPCNQTQGSTDIYSLKNKQLVFSKRIDNLNILAWDHSNLKNTVLVTNKVNKLDCSSKLELTTSLFQNNIFVTGGAEGSNARVMQIDDKKYIAINRVTTSVPIDPYSWSLIEGLEGNANSELEWLFENSIRRLYVSELFEVQDNKVRQIEKNKSRYGTAIYSFLKHNGDIYSLGFKNRKLSIQLIRQNN